MGTYKNVGMHPEDLLDGRMVGVGEEVDLTDEQVSDNQRLIDEEVFISLDSETKSSKKTTTTKEG
jgi:hypothetical protein